MSYKNFNDILQEEAITIILNLNNNTKNLSGQNFSPGAGNFNNQ